MAAQASGTRMAAVFEYLRMKQAQQLQDAESEAAALAAKIHELEVLLQHQAAACHPPRAVACHPRGRLLRTKD